MVVRVITFAPVRSASRSAPVAGTRQGHAAGGILGFLARRDPELLRRRAGQLHFKMVNTVRLKSMCV